MLDLTLVQTNKINSKNYNNYSVYSVYSVYLSIFSPLKNLANKSIYFKIIFLGPFEEGWYEGCFPRKVFGADGILFYFFSKIYLKFYLFHWTASGAGSVSLMDCFRILIRFFIGRFPDPIFYRMVTGSGFITVPDDSKIRILYFTRLCQDLNP